MSLLPDWYFATQLGLSPSEMNLFLTIIDVLRRPSGTRSADASRAIDEIALLERWAHIYTLPDVVRQLRLLGPERAGRVLSHIIDPIIEGAADSVRTPLEAAIQTFAKGFPPGETFPLLERVARGLTQPSVVEFPVSYIDIEDYAIEALLFSLALASAAEAPGLVASAFGRGADEEHEATPSLEILFTAAFEGRLGRWCFLLVLDLCLESPTFAAPDEIEDAILRCSARQLLSAPDLIARWVTLQFVFKPKRRRLSARRIIDSLYEELITFKQWRSLAARFGKSATTVIADEPNVLTFWQDSIWQAFLGMDPDEAGRRLALLWLPRVFRWPDAKRPIPVPSRGQLDEIRAIYERLATQMDSRIRFVVIADGSPSRFAGHWTALSPWIVAPLHQRRAHVEQSTADDGSQETDEVRTSQLLRCLTAAHFAARLLLTAANRADGTSRWRYFTAHVLHALRMWDRNASQHDPAKIGDVAGRNAATLMQVLAASLEKSAGGRFQYPSPESFFEIILAAQKERLIDPVPEGLMVKGDDAEAVRDGLVSSALRLIEYAMIAASDDGGRRRWLVLARDVTALVQGKKRLSDRRMRFLKKMLQRYLVSPMPPTTEWIEDGLSSVRDKKSWRVPHRQLLLTPTESADAWHLPNLAESEIWDTGALARGCQRVAAAMHDPTCDESLRSQWIDDLQESLSRVRERTPMDRFLRLRLIELIRDGTFSDRDLFIAAFSRVVEFGQALDLRLLVRSICSEPVTTQRQYDTRHAQFQILQQYRWRITGDPVAEAVDPDSRRDQWWRQRWVDRLFASCITATRGDQKDAAARLIGDGRVQRDVALGKRRPSIGSPVDTETDLRGRIRLSNLNDRSSHAIAAIVAVDRNSERALLVDPAESNGTALNLFSNPHLISRRERECVGVILAAAQEGATSNLNVALSNSHAIKVRAKAADFRLGAYAAVRCRPFDRKHPIRPDEIRGVTPLKPRTDPVREQATVWLEAPQNSQKKLRARLSKDGRVLEWSQRTSNFLAFHGLLGEAIFSIYVDGPPEEEADHRAVQASHEALTLDLVDLLLDHYAPGTPEQPTILCLQQVAGTLSGETESIIVEVLPSQRYRLFLEADFTAESRETLLEKLKDSVERGLKPSGLLIGVEVAVGEEGPRLKLSHSTVSLAKGAINYPPDLVLPFDDRNLRWRDLFAAVQANDAADDETAQFLLSATRDPALGTMFAKLGEMGVPGFPRQIQVNLVAGSAGRGESQFRVLLDSDSWDPRSATIRGDRVKENRLDVGNGLERVVSEIRDLAPSQHLRVEQYQRSVHNTGQVSAYTAYNLHIFVRAESLSMRPLLEPLEGIRARWVEITKVDWNRWPILPDIDPTEIPDRAFIGDCAIGILVAIPDAGTERVTTAIVAWCGSGPITEQSLEIRNLGELQRSGSGQRRRILSQGTRIIVTRQGAAVSALLDVPLIYAEALWQHDENEPAGQEIHRYIGEANFNGRVCEIFEVEQGVFRARPKPGMRSDPLCDWERFLRESNVPQARGGNKSSNPSRVRLELGTSESDDLAILCGQSYDGRSVAEGDLVGINLFVRATGKSGAESERYQLRRELRLQPVAHRPQPVRRQLRKDSAGDLSLEEARSRQLALWLETRKLLEGNHDGDDGRMQLHVTLRRLFPLGLPVGVGKVSHVLDRPLKSQFIKSDARGVLISQTPPHVSYVDAPPLTLEDLWEALDRESDKTIKLEYSRFRLFYAGCRTPSRPETEGIKREHIFEWGFGHWVAVPESRLRFKEKAIQSGDLRFYNGDRITGLQFIDRKRTPQDPQDGVLLSIENVGLSVAHSLYLQAKEDRIVHTIHVRMLSRGVPEIAYIEGFEARASADARRRFDVPRARLDAVGMQVIRERAQQESGESGEPWEGIILGRFDTSAYSKSFGQDVCFNYTRLDLTPRNGAGCLRGRDRLFVLTDKVNRYGENDIAIDLSAIPGLHPNDIGPEFARRRDGRYTDFLVTRRHFSYSEDTLVRLQRELQGDADGRYVMVRIRVVKGKFIIYIRDGTPPRQSEILDALHTHSEGGIFAIYAGFPDEARDRYRFELRPGIVVDLAPSSLDMPGSMLRGDVVRIVPIKSDKLTDPQIDTRYRIARATYSDIRYTSARRPVVALPMQNLSRETPPFTDIRDLTRAADSFTIGDFPGLRAHLRMLAPRSAGDGAVRNERQQYTLPALRDWMSFMSTPHPKLAWLDEVEQTEEQQAIVTITPDFTKKIYAGRLRVTHLDATIDGNGGFRSADMPAQLDKSEYCGYEVLAEALSSASSKLSDFRTDWAYLSFRDETAKALTKLVEHSAWKYHDETTIDWKTDDRTGGVVSNNPEIAPMSALAGPLFFSIKRGIATLRYSDDELSERSIGYKNLLLHLIDRPEGELADLQCAVAGVPRDEPAGEHAGLFLELLPGRIVEVPPEMISWQRNGDTVSLSSLAWHLFAPGDQATVRKLPQSDRYAPERILLDWDHGIRNAFGPIGAILRRTGLDLSAGAAIYGEGRFTVSIPSTDPKNLPNLALIGGDINVEAAPSHDRRMYGATVLLVKGTSAPVEIFGLEEWRFLPDKNWNWSDDTVMKPVISAGRNEFLSISSAKLLERIEIAGGVLPVTVEGIYRPAVVQNEDGRRPTLYFTRRYQDPRLKEGQIALAQVLGQIPGSGWVMLGVGACSFAMPSDRLVLGASDERRGTIINYLREQKTRIWVHRTKFGYGVGTGSPLGASASVRPIGLPGFEDGRFHGLLCVSINDQALRWLSAERAAAAPLTLAQAVAVFGDYNRRVPARVMPDEGVSLLEESKARQEINQLRIGHKLRVEEIEGTEEAQPFLPPDRMAPKGRLCLVRSRQSGVIMTGALPPRTVSGGPHTFIAEVAERQLRGGKINVLVVPSGERRISYDFPKWIALATADHPFIENAQFVVNADETFGGVTSRSVVGAFVEFLNQGKRLLTIDNLARFKLGYTRAHTVSLLAGIAAVCTEPAGMGADGPNGGSPERAVAALDVDLVRNIGNRALRSFHLEVLTRRSGERHRGYIPTSESMAIAYGVDSLLDELVAGNSPEKCRIALRHIVDCLALDGGSDHDKTVVHALAASIGEPIDLYTLIDAAKVTSEVVRIIRPILAFTSGGSENHSEIVRELITIGKSLIESNMDVPLMESLIAASE